MFSCKKSWNNEAFCMRIIMNYWIKQLSHSKLFFSTQYICLIRWLLERMVPPYVLFCLCVCSLLGSQDRFRSARRLFCSSATCSWGSISSLAPELYNPPLTGPHLHNPIPSLAVSTRPTGGCLFLHFSGLSQVHIRTMSKDTNTCISGH